MKSWRPAPSSRECGPPRRSRAAQGTMRIGTQRPRQTAKSGDEMHVLVVEDDRETAHFLQKALKESGHAADLAEDGETGQSLAEQGVYDVLIVDRMLPRLDGLSMIRELRNKGVRTPGAHSFRAGRGRRPRQRSAGRRRRLPDQALRLFGAAGARRSLGAPRRAGGAGDALRRRRAGARPPVAPRDARRRSRSSCSRASTDCSNI